MILVTGGAGFIGSHIVEALLASGEHPVVLDDLSGGDRANLPPGVELVEADVADPATAEVVAGMAPEAVVHAAAQVSVAASMRDPARDLAVNVTGTANVLSGAKEAGASRFVFLSSGGAVYGETDGADEAALPRPESYYGAHKYLAERYVELSGIPHANARLANVFGPRQRRDLEGGVVAIFADRLKSGGAVEVHGDGEQSRDFVFVGDVADAVLAMLRAEPSGTWNVGTGEGTSVNSLLRALEGAVGSAPEVRRAPARPGDVRVSRLSVGAIERDLGWRAGHDLASGLALTVSAETVSAEPETGTGTG